MEIHDPALFLSYFDKIRERTLRVAICVPAEQMEWRPTPDAFSFGDTLRHVGAIERYMFVENALGRPSAYPGCGPELANGAPAVHAFLARMHAESLELLGGLAPDDLLRACTTPGGGTMPVWKWLRAMVEHEVHHRGQLYLMLRLIGVATPPIFGLTADQVQANSVPRVG